MSPDDAVIEDIQQAENRRLFDMLNAEVDTEMDESEPDTTAEKRVFDWKNAEVKDGFYLCNTCDKPVCKATLKEGRAMSQFFSK